MEIEIEMSSDATRCSEIYDGVDVWVWIYRGGTHDEVEVEVEGEVRNIIHYLYFWYH